MLNKVLAFLRIGWRNNSSNIDLAIFCKKLCYNKIMKTLEIPNKNNLIDIMRRNQIEFAALFGSHAKGTAKENSDYDILIEFSPEAQIGLFRYQDIENEIASILGKKVDLVTIGGIDKYIKDEVTRTMKVIYDNRSKK